MHGETSLSSPPSSTITEPAPRQNLHFSAESNPGDPNLLLLQKFQPGVLYARASSIAAWRVPLGNLGGERELGKGLVALDPCPVKMDVAMDHHVYFEKRRIQGFGSSPSHMHHFILTSPFPLSSPRSLLAFQLALHPVMATFYGSDCLWLNMD
ncbi:hypothetical protein SADUNF_Sadunf05G0180000 [Salix dunnii]|uniref:Uncharacterized protein n=1 Tax=Salix dunnii TaxID=1413687 RepID=A0A835KDQ3_9ROSI|nr:hypothetical protein SADUNF_Sadunf05G0180000 [Salix dunnii]